MQSTGQTSTHDASFTPSQGCVITNAIRLPRPRGNNRGHLSGSPATGRGREQPVNAAYSAVSPDILSRHTDCVSLSSPAIGQPCYHRESRGDNFSLETDLARSITQRLVHVGYPCHRGWRSGRGNTDFWPYVGSLPLQRRVSRLGRGLKRAFRPEPGGGN